MLSMNTKPCHQQQKDRLLTFWQKNFSDKQTKNGYNLLILYVFKFVQQFTKLEHAKTIIFGIFRIQMMTPKIQKFRNSYLKSPFKPNLTTCSFVILGGIGIIIQRNPK